MILLKILQVLIFLEMFSGHMATLLETTFYVYQNN